MEAFPSSSPALRLETGVEADQEGVVGRLLEDVLLRLDPVDVLEDEHSQTSVKDH